MAKSRAQRKAERKKREARQQAQARKSGAAESQAQHDTQVPESADVAEAELAERGANLDELRGSEPEAPAPSRADVGKPSAGPIGAGEVEEEEEEPAREGDGKQSRRERRRAEREERQRKKESEERRKPKDEPTERQRGRVVGFLASCVAELRRVQWPDRETLIQASAITLIFIAVAAAYLGVLDAIFSELVQIII